MNRLLSLALHSLWSRRITALLTVFAIAVSVALLLGVEKLRIGAREGFAATVSGTDLIVGPRTGPLNPISWGGWAAWSQTRSSCRTSA